MLPLAAFVFLNGCPEPGTTSPGADKASVLINSVWAGETPRAGDWLTITFRPEKKVIWSFSVDNTTNEWDYSFDDKNQGTITNPQGLWNPAPNGFTVSGNTLTITNYGSHGGASREFRRVRQADLTVDPVPFTPGILAGNLVNSVWAGETPRLGDWLTITFRPDGKVIWSFSVDNTTNEWEYTFDEAENAGKIIIHPDPEDPEPWHPAPNGFTVSGNTLTITNYGFHGGNPREFKRYR
jgi:hypothetical protein